MGTKSSGKAREFPFAAKYKVIESMISLITLSRASCVCTCFFASLRETSVSGIALSYRGLGFELKKPKLEVSIG